MCKNESTMCRTQCSTALQPRGRHQGPGVSRKDFSLWKKVCVLSLGWVSVRTHCPWCAESQSDTVLSPSATVPILSACCIDYTFREEAGSGRRVTTGCSKVCPSLPARIPQDPPGSRVFCLLHFCLEPPLLHTTGCRLWSVVTSLVASEVGGHRPLPEPRQHIWAVLCACVK